MCSILSLKKDIWQLVAEYLSNKDLLSVRACCKYLDQIVTKMNVRWYQEHQWFIKKYIGHHKVKSRNKIHTYKHDWHCVPKTEYKSWSQDRNERISSFKAGFDTSGCNDKNHMGWVSTNLKKDIPLNDKNFKITKHSYMYSYLIEWYRYHVDKTKRMTSGDVNGINRCRRKIAQLEDDIIFTKMLMTRYEDSMVIIKRKRYKNDVFENVKRIDTYGKNKKIKK